MGRVDKIKGLLDNLSRAILLWNVLVLVGGTASVTALLRPYTTLPTVWLTVFVAGAVLFVAGMYGRWRSRRRHAASLLTAPTPDLPVGAPGQFVVDPYFPDEAELDIYSATHRAMTDPYV